MNWNRIGEFVLNSLSIKGQLYNLVEPLVVELYAKKATEGSEEVIEYKAALPKLELWVTAEKLEFCVKMLCELLIELHATIGAKKEGLSDTEKLYISLFKK